ncbi:MAG: hypothetical protein HF962_01605, partial [Sulfurovum sp.]|nr:hypothetical protein [Sulfurovum sp.]
LFLVDRIKHESNFEIFNLNEIYSEERNSLHYNVLEAIKQLGIVDDEVFRLLKKYGHEEKEVLSSLKILEDRTNSLIVPLRTNESIRGERSIVMVTEYGITKKGEKYLEMIDLDDEWKCYRDVIGLPGKSIKELL